MKESRMHHYVPRCYLKRFTSGGTDKSKFYALDVLEKKSFWPTPSGMCVVRDFNRVNIPGQPSDILETTLSKFDSQLGQALRTIERDRDFRDEQTKLVLLNFASVVAARNPELRARMEDFQRRMYEMTMSMTVGTRELYESTVRSAKRSGHLSENANIPYEKMKEFVDEKRYKLSFPDGFHIPAEFSSQDTVLQTMVGRKWALLRAPKGAEFITSDMPVCLLQEEASRFPPGYGMNGTIVLLPVTSSLLMVGKFDGLVGVFDIDRADVAHYNAAIAMRCNRFVFARSEKFETILNDDHVYVGEQLLLGLKRSKRFSNGPRAADD